MSTELMITIGVLIVQFALLAIVFIKSRQPPIPGKVRVFPYTVVIIILTFTILLTVAHIISLLTGTQLQPKRRRGL